MHVGLVCRGVHTQVLRHYKRKTVSEQRVGGVRQQQALMSAVAEVVAVAPSVMSVRAVAVQCPYKEFPVGLTNVGGSGDLQKVPVRGKSAFSGKV